MSGLAAVRPAKILPVRFSMPSVANRYLAEGRMLLLPSRDEEGGAVDMPSTFPGAAVPLDLPPPVWRCPVRRRPRRPVHRRRRPTADLVLVPTPLAHPELELSPARTGVVRPPHLPRVELLGPHAAVLLRLGTRWRNGDGAATVEALRTARARGGLVVLVHSGAGGGAFLRTATAEDPRLRVVSLRGENLQPDASSIHLWLSGGWPVTTEDLSCRPGPRASLPAPTMPSWRPVRLPPAEQDPALPGPSGQHGHVLVTSGLSEFGLHLAERLVALGRPLWLVDRRAPGTLPTRLVHRLRRLTEHVPVQVDRFDPQEPADLERLSRRDLPVWGLVHAPPGVREVPADQVTGYELDRLARLGTGSWEALVRFAVPRGLSRAVCLGSVLSRSPVPGFSVSAHVHEQLRLGAGRLARACPQVALTVAEWALPPGRDRTSPGRSTTLAARRAELCVRLLARGRPHTEPSTRLVVLPAPSLTRPEEGSASIVPGIAGVVAVPPGSSGLEELERLVAGCAPAHLRPAHRPGIGPGQATGLLRAVVAGNRIDVWSAPLNAWEPDGLFRDSVPLVPRAPGRPPTAAGGNAPGP